jgi:hypothetical protein
VERWGVGGMSGRWWNVRTSDGGALWSVGALEEHRSIGALAAMIENGGA